MSKHHSDHSDHEVASLSFSEDTTETSEHTEAEKSVVRERSLSRSSLDSELDYESFSTEFSETDSVSESGEGNAKATKRKRRLSVSHKLPSILTNQTSVKKALSTKDKKSKKDKSKA